MALSTSTRVATRATIAAAGTSVAPGIPLPDNCSQIVFLNRSAAQVVLIGQGAPGGALLDNGTNTAVPAGATLTWDVGVRSKRLDPLTDLIYDCDAANANLDITYLCHSGVS
jgi:hypothetical protein